MPALTLKDLFDFANKNGLSLETPLAIYDIDTEKGGFVEEFAGDLFPGDFNYETETYEGMIGGSYYYGKTGRFSELAERPVIVLKGC